MAVDTSLPKQRADSDGLDPAFTNLNAVDTFGWKNSGREVLWVRNDNAGAIVLTIVTTKTVDGAAVADKTYTIPASERRAIAGLAAGVYNDTDGFTNVTCDTATGVSAAVVTSSR